MCTLAVYKGGHGECLVNLLCKSLKAFWFWDTPARSSRPSAWASWASVKREAALAPPMVPSKSKSEILAFNLLLGDCSSLLCRNLFLLCILILSESKRLWKCSVRVFAVCVLCLLHRRLTPRNFPIHLPGLTPTQELKGKGLCRSERSRGKD